MAVYSSNLASGGPNVYGQNSDAYLFTVIPWVFTVSDISAKSTLNAQQLEDGVDSYIILMLTTSDGSAVQRKINLTQVDRTYYTANLTINVPAYGWVHLDAQYVNAQVFWSTANADLAGGWTGSGTTRSQVGFFDVDFTIIYDAVWTVDGQNDNYARIAAYDTIEFDEFEKDADGYPLNWGVWKLDDQNEGYPWPTGYLPARIHGGQVAVFTANGLETGLLYVFTENGLVPASIPIIFT